MSYIVPTTKLKNPSHIQAISNERTRKMLVFIVLLSSVIIIDSLLEFFFLETRAGQALCRSFREAMRRNNKSRSKSSIEDDDK